MEGTADLEAIAAALSGSGMREGRDSEELMREEEVVSAAKSRRLSTITAAMISTNKQSGSGAEMGRNRYSCSSP